MPGRGPARGGDLPGPGLGVVHDHQQRHRRVPEHRQVLDGGVPAQPQPRPPLITQPARELVGQPGLALPAGPVQQTGREPRPLRPAGQVLQQPLAAAEGHHLVTGPQQRRRGAHRIGFGLDQLLQLHRLQHHLTQAVPGQGGPEPVVPVQQVGRDGLDPGMLHAGRVCGDHPGQQVVAEQGRPGQPAPRRGPVPGRCRRGAGQGQHVPVPDVPVARVQRPGRLLGLRRPARPLDERREPPRLGVGPGPVGDHPTPPHPAPTRPPGRVVDLDQRRVVPPARRAPPHHHTRIGHRIRRDQDLHRRAACGYHVRGRQDQPRRDHVPRPRSGRTAGLLHRDDPGGLHARRSLPGPGRQCRCQGLSGRHGRRPAAAPRTDPAHRRSTGRPRRAVSGST